MARAFGRSSSRTRHPAVARSLAYKPEWHCRARESTRTGVGHDICMSTPDARLIRLSFKITDASYERAVARIESTVGDANADLADGRKSLLGGDAINYTDLAFAVFTGAWLMPSACGGGRAETVRIERWPDAFPEAVSYVEGLYQKRWEESCLDM